MTQPRPIDTLLQAQTVGEVKYVGPDYTLFQGDCVEEMRKMADSSVDVVVTSPPYNIGKTYVDYDDQRSEGDYLAFMERVGEQLARVVKPDGHVFVNVGYTNVKPWTAMDVASQFRNHFELQNQFVWVKSIAINDVTTGNFKPINSGRFVTPTNESVFHFTRSGKETLDRHAIGVPFMHKGNLARFQHEADVRCRGNTWFVPYAPINRSGQRGDGHPAAFPIDLPTMCIRLTGKTQGIVLDPFVGSGTTMEAAKQCGLKGVGIDISPTYLKTASPEKTWPPLNPDPEPEHEEEEVDEVAKRLVLDGESNAIPTEPDPDPEPEPEPEQMSMGSDASSSWWG